MTVAQLKEKIKDLPDEYNIQEKQVGFIANIRYEFEIIKNNVIVHKFYENNPPWKNN